MDGWTKRALDLVDHRTTAAEHGDGPVLVLLHAIGLDHDMWRALGSLLPDRRLIAYDMRGFGTARGAPLPSWPTIESWADDLDCLLDGLGVTGAGVLGLSFGGAVARVWAARAASRPASLTLVATPVAPNPLAADRARRDAADGIGGQLGETLRRWFAPKTLSEDPMAVRYARDRLQGVRGAAWQAGWAALATIPAFRETPPHCPALIVAAEQDRAVPIADLRAATRAWPGSRFHVVPGAEHMFALEQPSILADVILAGLVGSAASSERSSSR